MSNKTIEQAYLAREQMKKEIEGAAESSRAALSAISGRNILKTKTETAKIRRDEELAAQQRAASIALAQADQGVSMEKSRLAYDQAAQSRAEQERRSIRSVEAQELADRRQEAMDMLSLGIYDPSFSADLGFKDSVVREFAEKKNAEFQQKQAAKAKVAQAQAEYEQALKDIENFKNVTVSQKVEQRKANIAADEDTPEQIKSGVNTAIEEAEKTGRAFKSLEEAKTWVATNSGIDLRSKPQMEKALRYFDYAMQEKVLKKQLLGMTAEGYTALERLVAPNVKTKQEARKTETKQTVPAWVTQEVERLKKVVDAAGSLAAAAQKEVARIADAKVLLQEATDEAGKQSAYSYYLERLEGGIKSTVASAEQTYSAALKKQNNLEEISAEENKEIEAQIQAVEGMIEMLEDGLKTIDLTVEQQEIVSSAAEHLGEILPALESMNKYAVSYEENHEIYEAEKERREMDAEYGGYSIEELEGYAAEWQKAIDKRIGPSTYTNDRVRYNERQKEIDRLRSYIETRKKEQQNKEEAAQVDLWVADRAEGSRPEKISGFFDGVRQRWEDLMQYSTIMTGTAQYAPSEMTLQMVRVTDENGEETGEFYYLTRDGERLPSNLDMNKEEDRQKLAQIQQEIGELSKKQQTLTNTYYINLKADVEGEISPEDAEKIAEGFSATEFKERAADYTRTGGKFFDGNYNSYDEDVLGFSHGDYGAFLKEEGDRVLALLAQGRYDLAFDYYATVREQSLLRKAEDLQGWWRTTKGLFSGLTRFATQGLTMLENAASGSYERMAGTLGTASHQVTMEKLDGMGIGGEALEVLYMGGYTILDMVPAVALSFVPVVGQSAAGGYIFAKSMATTYTDDVAKGKRADEALTHGILSGTAEVAMEKILGGIPQIGSKFGITQKLSGAIDNLAATSGMKKALKVASSMGAEGFEEFLQEVISPFLSKVAADLNGIEGAELREIDWEEAGRSFLLGAITGGAFSMVNLLAESRAMEIEAARTLQRGEIEALAAIGAKLGNKTALSIKTAMQNGQPRYAGQTGVAAYASAKDITNIQKSIRRRRVKQANGKLGQLIESNMEGASNEDIAKAKGIFRKILSAKTLTLEEASAIARDERLLQVLEAMMGEKLLRDLSPRQVAVLARLASFTDENGKVSSARIALFKDAFGEFDTEAIEKLLRYDSMAGLLADGVVFENKAAAESLTDSEREAVETLNALSEMTGYHFLITENQKTGDYLAAGLMAVNPNELNQGIFYAIGHRAYQMTMQLNPESGLRQFILDEAKKTLGEESLEAEITEILRQKAVKGLDYTREMAEDELCAQWLPQMLLKGESIEKIAQGDIEMANTLRKCLRSIQEHLVNVSTPTEIRTDMPENYRYNYLKNKTMVAEESKDLSPYQEELDELAKLNPRAKSKSQSVIEEIAAKAEVLNKPLSHPELDYSFAFSKDSLKKSIHHQMEYGGDFLGFAKALINIEEILANAVLVERHSDKYSGTKRANEHLEHTSVFVGAIKNGNSIIPVQLEIKKSDTGQNTLYLTVALKNVDAKKIEADVMEPVWNKEDSAQALLSTSNISISKLFENVNPEDKNFLKYVPERFLNDNQRAAKTKAMDIEGEKIGNLFKDQGGKQADLWGNTNAVYEKLTALIKQDRADRYGWKNGEGDTTSNDPLFDEIVATLHINDDSPLIGTQQKFIGTAAVQKAGIKIDGSVGLYDQDIDAQKRLAKDQIAARRKIRDYTKRNKITTQEEQAAKDLANGEITYDEAEGLEGIRYKKVKKLSELLAEKQGLQKANIKKTFMKIKGDLTELAREDAAKLIRKEGIGGAAQNVAQIPFLTALETPRRVFQLFFGLQNGAEVFARWYKPIEENNRNKNLFIGQHLEKVREKTGGKWSREERQVAQMLIEAQLYDDAVANEQNGIAYRNAVKDVYEQTLTPAEAMKEYGIRDFEKLIQCVNAYEVKVQAQEIIDGNKIDTQKLQPAIEAVREEYAILYDALNDFLVAHGMEPIPFIRYYTPHMQIDSTLDKFRDAIRRIGTQEGVTSVPVEIAGKTHEYRPNRKWNPHMKERTGAQTDYDLLVSYQAYLNYFSNVIFHTDDIMRLRALEKAVRLEFSKSNIKDRHAEAVKAARGTLEEQNQFLREVGEISGKTVLSQEDAASKITEYMDKLAEEESGERNAVRFARWIQDMANIRAGKQSALDRGWEAMFEREGLAAFTKYFGRLKAGKVAGSISSLLKQHLQIVPAISKCGAKYAGRALWDIAVNWKENAAFADEIALLVGKRDVNPLAEGAWSKIGSWIGAPMQWVDYMTSLTVAKAGYQKAIDMGMDDQTAKQYANEFATKIMGSRQNAEKPQGFHSKNPILQGITAFAVEAHNSIQNITFDTVSEFAQIKRTKGAKEAMKYVMRGMMLYFVLAFFGNRAEDELMNQTPIPFDIIGILTQGIAAGQQQTAREFWMQTIDNVCEDIGGERIFETERGEQDFDVKAMFGMIGEEMLDDFIIPSNILSTLGITGTSLFNDVPLSLRQVYEDGMAMIKDPTWENFGELAIDVISALPVPLANQIRKTAQGTWTIAEGGNYRVNSDGERQLLYPVTGWWDKAKTAVFGKYASYDAQRYFDTNEKILTVKQTTAYDDLLAEGVDAQAAYDTILELRKIRKENDREDRDAQREYIQSLTMTDKQKMILFKYTLSDSETVTESVKELSAAGVSNGDIMDAYNEYREIDADETLDKEKDKATEFAYFLDQTVEDPADRKRIKAAKGFTYGVLDVAEPKEYEAMTGSGVSYDDAYEVYFAVSGLEPEDDKDTVSAVAKYSAIGKCGLPEESAKAALLTYATDADERRMKLSFEDDITADQFITVKENLEIANKAAGKENNSNGRIRAAITATDGLTLRQQAVLWQLFTGSTSAKNNPFSASVGWETVAKIKAYKAALEEE